MSKIDAKDLQAIEEFLQETEGSSQEVIRFIQQNPELGILTALDYARQIIQGQISDMSQLPQTKTTQFPVKKYIDRRGNIKYSRRELTREEGYSPVTSTFSTGMGIDESAVEPPQLPSIPYSSTSMKGAEVDHELGDVNNLYRQGRTVPLANLFDSFQGLVDERGLSKTGFTNFLRENYSRQLSDVLYKAIMGGLNRIRFRDPPPPGSGVVTGEGTKQPVKPKKPLEGGTPLGGDDKRKPKPKKPRQPDDDEDDDDDDDEDDVKKISKRKLRMLRKGRMRSRFPREHNRYTDSKYIGEDFSSDELFGDDIDEHAILEMELNTWKNKFYEYELDTDNPLAMMKVMDTALKFMDEPYIYSRGMSSSCDFDPDFGFVYH
jgi:hypothetical protein